MRTRLRAGRSPGRFLSALAVVAALAPAAASAQDSAVVLVYHRFGESQHPSTSVALDQFDRQLAAIRDGGHTVLSLPDLVDALASGAPIPDRAVAITIDDGYASTYREAWPRLNAYRFPFTVFVSTDAADDGAGDLMNWQQIRELAADPAVTIGHHGAAHAHMADLDMAAAEADLARADTRYVAELGSVPALFAYPYGEYGLDLRNMVAARGFAAAFGQHSGVADRWDDRFALPRFSVNTNTDHEAFALRLAAMALPASELMPADPLVTPADNPPQVSFRVMQPADGGGPLRLDALSCFINGAAVPVSIEGDRVSAVLAGALDRGRSRLNCTMPAAHGRWRWMGMQFYRP